MKPLLTREVKLLTRDGGALIQVWLLPLLVLFVAGLFLPATALTTDMVTLLVLFTLLMVTLPLTARLWHDDMASGALEQIALADNALLPAVIARQLALFVGVYLPVCALVAGGMGLWLQYEMPTTQLLAMLLLSLATLSLAQLVAALTVTVRNGGLLVALLLIPFLLPVFVAFAALPQVPVALDLLGAAAVLAAPLCVLATASVLRQQLSV